MLYKAGEIKAMTNAEIIDTIFSLGVCCSNDRGTKQDDLSLQRCFKELERRGVIDNWEKAYNVTLL